MEDLPSRRRLENVHPFLGIHAINVFVRSQDESVRFYVGQLGFDLIFDARLQSGERWVAVAPPDGSAVLALVTPRAGSDEAALIGRSTGILFVTEDVAAKFNEWRKRGVHFLFTPRLRPVKYQQQKSVSSRAVMPGVSDQQSPWGGVFTSFKDPDGNTFGLASFDTVTAEVEAQRRRAAERLEAERRAAQELEIAKQVQARLFPQKLPSIETLEYAGCCVQARQVGGDYHDVLDLGRGRFGLVIADISGKGIAAALLMANLQANLRSQCASAVDEPERFLCSVNRLFYENTNDSAYATLFFGEYDDRTRRMRFANCGHLPPLIIRCDGTVERLEPTSTVLGLFEEWECGFADCSLTPGDTIAFYTDGITESVNDAGEDFGEQRLIEALTQHQSLPPQSQIASIVEAVQRFDVPEQHDDITLIVARCLAGPSNSAGG